MIRSIETGTNNEILRAVSEPVGEITRQIRKLARDMKATIGPAGGMGLAAPQVGEHVRMILITIPGEYYEDTGFAGCQLDKHMILINPEITKFGADQCSFEEGCLSLPDYFADVIRPCEVEFTALDEKGNRIGGEATGIFARILQHEIDHLDGILFDDHVLNKKKKDPSKIYI